MKDRYRLLLLYSVYCIMTYTVVDIKKKLNEGNTRVVFENVSPEIHGGRFPIKRVLNGEVKIFAELFTDGHNLISGKILYRNINEKEWKESELIPIGNEGYKGSFIVDTLGVWEYTLIGWIDEFATWQMNLSNRLSGDNNIAVELKTGMRYLSSITNNVPKNIGEKLKKTLKEITNKNKVNALNAALDKSLLPIMVKYGKRKNLSVYENNLKIIVEPEIAGFSAWYEMFPRSNWGDCKGHATFKTVEKRLDYINDMGFNILYFPPIHPIGKLFRKGKNNSVKAEKNDVGSPWAIGGKQGGHKAVLPQLGSLKEFKHLVKIAKKKGIFIALDIAYQCSPDHPYVKEHSEWFKKRPDNTIQYAENPPKKYQDIYPFDFSTEHWQELWEELKSIVLFWINNGVTIFRVDNPHTKSLSFWEWLITEIKKENPETIFLAEAFTRPRMMYRLAKLGFSQSYTYFAWRNTKSELINYLNELNNNDKIDYYRPNFWPNTPDILNEFLQHRDRNAFKVRFILAALLSPNYGIYGPAFELCENIPIKEYSEEYMNSEKYEICKWNIDNKRSISHFISKVNGIRNNNSIYRSNINFEFLNIDNENLLAFARYSDDFSDIHIIIINIDTNWKQAGWLELPIDKFNIERGKPYQVYDQLNNNYYIWNDNKNYIELNPKNKIAHVFEIRKLKKTEKNFDYYI